MSLELSSFQVQKRFPDDGPAFSNRDFMARGRQALLGVMI
jgi:hypothetical protein